MDVFRYCVSRSNKAFIYSQNYFIYSQRDTISEVLGAIHPNLEISGRYLTGTIPYQSSLTLRYLRDVLEKWFNMVHLYIYVPMYVHR